MQILNNELYVQRGEAFTLDFLLQNKDKSPYIMSSELSSPSFLVTISSMLQNPDNRYILNKWCMINEEKYPRFYVTKPVKVDSFTNGVTWFSNFKNSAKQDGKKMSEYCVLYTQTYDGVTSYKYYNDNTEPTSSDYNNLTFDETKLKDYENRFSVTFTSAETLKWTEQFYKYGIQLVSGKLKADATDERPYDSYDNILAILTPTKMVVTGNMLGNFKGATSIWQR